MYQMLSVLAVILLPAVIYAAPRIGDAGSVPDPERFDANYPLMKEWAKAGVSGGIPARDKTRIAKTLNPGDDIQAAIDAAGDEPVVIVLAAGVHTRETPIRMKSNVILRGADRDKSILEYDNPKSRDVGEAVRFSSVSRAALEDLTLRHTRIHKMNRNSWVGVYEPNPKVADLPTGNYAAVDIRGSSDCWVDNCRLLDSVSRPVRIHSRSRHITFRDTLIDGAFYKGAGGSGYCEIIDAQYTLFFNNTIRNIRHVCLDGNCDYTVIKDCRLQVDLNWHFGRPMGKCLIETTASYLHPWHWWRTCSRFVDKVSADNLIYKHDAWCKNKVEFEKGTPAPAPDANEVYTLRTNYEEQPWVYKVATPPPAHGTLYAVTGSPLDDAADTASRKAFHAELRPLLENGDEAALRNKAAEIVQKYPGKLAAYYAQDVIDILNAAEAAGKDAGSKSPEMTRAGVYRGKGLFYLAKRVAKQASDSDKAFVEGLEKLGY